MAFEKPRVFSEQSEMDSEYLEQIKQGEEIVEFIEKQLPEWRRIAARAGVTLYEQYFPSDHTSLLQFQNFLMNGCFKETQKYTPEQLKYKKVLFAHMAEAEVYIKAWQRSMDDREPFSQA